MGGLVCEHGNMRPYSSTRFIYGSNPECKKDELFSYGYISGILSARMPKVLAMNSYPKSDVLKIEDWDQKISKILETTLDKDIEVLGGIPTYLISIFEKMLERTGKKYIKDIWPNIKTFV